jgi:uncharacterized protein YwgA
MAMNDSERYGTISHVLKKLGETRLYFGKVVIQKIFYFLRSYSKLPFPYDFYFYHFGPYSDTLEHDLEMMELFGIIKIESDPKGMGYKIVLAENPTSVECEKTAGPFIRQYSEQIGKIISLFGSEEPADLELLATIHYVFERTKELRIEAKRHKQVVLEKVRELKPKFLPEVIEEKYDFLDKRNFLTFEKQGAP